MAQQISDIQNEMLAEMANHPELAPLNSTSNTSIWRLWMFITATIIYYFETIMDLFKVDVQNLLNNNIYGTNAWWLTQLYNFQYGDTLAFINNVFQYAVVNTANQVVEFASITSVNGVIQIKVAGLTGGQPSALTQAQLNGVISYCNQIQPAGIRFAVQSLAPDNLKLTANIHYDPLADITVVQPAVEAAINNFLVAKNTTNFDGSLYINKLIDAIQAVPGLIGNKVDIVYIAAKNGSGTYLQFTSSYPPQSGYFIIDPNFPLSTSLTYLVS
jgi:hypothetical protein